MAPGESGRGVLTSKIDRINILKLINEAISSGCRQNKPCEVFNIQERTLCSAGDKVTVMSAVDPLQSQLISEQDPFEDVIPKDTIGL